MNPEYAGAYARGLLMGLLIVVAIVLFFVGGMIVFAAHTILWQVIGAAVAGLGVALFWKAK